MRDKHIYAMYALNMIKMSLDYIGINLEKEGLIIKTLANKHNVTIIVNAPEVLSKRLKIHLDDAYGIIISRLNIDVLRQTIASNLISISSDKYKNLVFKFKWV